DEGRRILRPAVLDRQQIEVWLIEHDLLPRAATHRLRHRVGESLELPEPAHLLDDALGRLHLEDVLEPRGDRVERLRAEREAHAALAAELVDEQRVTRPPRVLEEEGRSAGLDGAVDDLRHLEERIDLGIDLDELALPAKQVDPGAQVARGHEAESIPRAESLDAGK